MAQEIAAGFEEIEVQGGVAVTDDAPGRVIMLEFRQKGVAVLLTYPEALALGRALRTLGKGEHRTLGGINGPRA